MLPSLDFFCLASLFRVSRGIRSSNHWLESALAPGSFRYELCLISSPRDLGKRPSRTCPAPKRPSHLEASRPHSSAPTSTAPAKTGAVRAGQRTWGFQAWNAGLERLAGQRLRLHSLGRHLETMFNANFAEHSAVRGLFPLIYNHLRLDVCLKMTFLTPSCRPLAARAWR